MDCNQALEYISAALDGELTAEEVAELDAHLADCPECQALAEECQRILTLVDGQIIGERAGKEVPTHA